MLPQRARCLGCRYALAGVAVNRCPECGREFDPSNRLTFSIPGDEAEWHRHALRAPGWPLNGIGAVTCLILMWAFSPPAGSYMLTTLGGGVQFFLCGVMWIARLDQARRAAKATGAYRTHLRPRWRRWMLLPAMFAVTLLLLQVQAPRHARFAVARPTLERAAKTALNPPAGWTKPFKTEAPLLTTHGPRVENGVVLFEVPRVGFLDYFTLVYLPEGATSDAIPSYVMRPRHFSGRWHVGEVDF